VTGILSDVKKTLNIDPDVTDFDLEVIMHINGVFGTLNQLGIGPSEGLEISDDTVTWDSLIGTEVRLNAVKTYVYLRVRRLFDPPTTSYLVDAYAKQIEELEWRLTVAVDEIAAASV
jgi:hypothetical protein